MNLGFFIFSTLPNGQPTMSATAITPSFNYDNFGVHFSAPIGNPRVVGSAGMWDLRSEAAFQRDWLIADLLTPTGAVGAFFPGGTTLSAFDAGGGLLGQATFNGSSGAFFVGIVSTIPIARVTFDEGGDGEDIADFRFAPIPEPATLGLAVFGAILLRKRHS